MRLENNILQHAYGLIEGKLDHVSQPPHHSMAPKQKLPRMVVAGE